MRNKDGSFTSYLYAAKHCIAKGWELDRIERLSLHAFKIKRA